MGCLFVLKCKKNKSDESMHIKRSMHNNNVPTVLPEPQTQARSLQSAPPSFRTRVKSINPFNNVTNNRTRVLSAPSSLDAAKQNGLALVEYEKQEESKHLTALMKEKRLPTPQPLPLPCPPSYGALRATSSFKLGNFFGGPLHPCGPLPIPPTRALRNFMYEEIAAACHNFSADRCMSECLSSTMYRASFGDDALSLKKFEATVTRLHSSTQSLKEFINEVNTLASLQHPNLCKLLGFHARDGSPPRMLIYERLYHGSLDRKLFSRFDGPPLDWNTRIKIAISAAQGLTFLHEEGPFQAMYKEFSTANIQLGKDFNAKLSGYGCVGHIPQKEISIISSAMGNYLSPETIEKGMLTPKSNVWSFGVILLELLTGRKNLDSRYPKEERNLLKWSRPFLGDDYKLSSIMDPKLKGRFPCLASRKLADIIKKCLQKEPSERPTMRRVVTHLKLIQDMSYSPRFPLKESPLICGNQMSKSPSFNGIKNHAPRLSYSPPQPQPQPQPQPLPLPIPTFSPPRWSGLPTLPSSRASSSTLLMENLKRLENKKSSSHGSKRASVDC